MRKQTITAIVTGVLAVSLWAVPTASAWFAVANAPSSPTQADPQKRLRLNISFAASHIVYANN
jgi:hypothetical protein